MYLPKGELFIMNDVASSRVSVTSGLQVSHKVEVKASNNFDVDKPSNTIQGNHESLQLILTMAALVKTPKLFIDNLRFKNTNNDELSQRISHLIDDNYSELEKIFKPYYFDKDECDKGDIGKGVQYERFFRSGKQLPVNGVSFTFPDGYIVRTVVKTSNKDIPKENNVIRDGYPMIYGKFDYEDSRNVYLLEYVDGFDYKRGKEEFDNLISQEAYQEQLASDLFPVIDSLFAKTNYYIEDISPVAGHNVIFDKEKKVFRFFDTDTISKSNLSKDEKWLRLFQHLDFRAASRMMNASVINLEDKHIRFMFHILKKALEANPDLSLQKSEKSVHAKGLDFVEPDFSGVLRNSKEEIINDNAAPELYDSLRRNLLRRRMMAARKGEEVSQFSKDPSEVNLPILLQRNNILTVTKVRDELKEAAKSNDYNLFSDLLKQSNKLISEEKIIQ